MALFKLKIEFSDNFEHRASVRASLAKDGDWIGQYFGKIVSMFQWQENMTLNSLPGRTIDVIHPEGKGVFAFLDTYFPTCKGRR